MTRYYALAYLTKTGAVLDELPLAMTPPWLQLINDPGSWTCYVPVGGTGLPKDKYLEYTEQEWKIGVAVCYGSGLPTDVVCQAGPILPSSGYGMVENRPVAQLGGTGFWGLLNARLQVASGWNGTAVTSAGGADTTYTSSLQGIAVGILNNAVARDPLPLDIPAAIAGTNTRTYHGYEFATVGQRLAELTQVQNGPDIVFQPYLAANGSQIRHQALIGNPTLGQPSNALRFDYPGNISSIMPTRDPSKMAKTVYVKGNGVEYNMLWASATDPTLVDWPLLEYVDTSHSDVTDQATLNGYAQAGISLYGRSVETWTVRNRMDQNPTFGSYTPGIYAYYNIHDHPFRRDGEYFHRILGFQVQQSDPIGEVRHILQSTAGEL